MIRGHTLRNQLAVRSLQLLTRKNARRPTHAGQPAQREPQELVPIVRQYHRRLRRRAVGKKQNRRRRVIPGRLHRRDLSLSAERIFHGDLSALKNNATGKRNALAGVGSSTAVVGVVPEAVAVAAAARVAVDDVEAERPPAAPSSAIASQRPTWYSPDSGVYVN